MLGGGGQRRPAGPPDARRVAAQLSAQTPRAAELAIWRKHPSQLVFG